MPKFVVYIGNDDIKRLMQGTERDNDAEAILRALWEAQKPETWKYDIDVEKIDGENKD